MAETNNVDRNRVLRVTDNKDYVTANFTSGGLVKYATTDYLEVVGNADDTDPGIQITAKNDGATDVDIALNPKGAGTLAIGGTGGTTIAAGGLTLTAGDLGLTLGDLTLTAGNIVNTLGNLTLTAGDFTMTSGNQTITSGDLTLSSGNLSVAGDLTATGTITLAANGSGAASGGTVAAAETVPTVHQTTLTLTATPITITDEGGVGQYGGVKIYDFPEGHLVVLGALVTGDITAAAPIIDAWNGDVALGTVAPTSASLQTTKSDIMQSSPTGTASSKVAAVDAVTAATQLTESGARWLDGTGTAKDCYLNLIIDDDVAHTGAMSATFTGTVKITWINLGDN